MELDLKGSIAQFLILDECPDTIFPLDYSSNIGVWGRNPGAIKLMFKENVNSTLQ